MSNLQKRVANLEKQMSPNNELVLYPEPGESDEAFVLRFINMPTEVNGQKVFMGLDPDDPQKKMDIFQVCDYIARNNKPFVKE